MKGVGEGGLVKGRVGNMRGRRGACEGEGVPGLETTSLLSCRNTRINDFSDENLHDCVMESRVTSGIHPKCVVWYRDNFSISPYY